MSGGRAAWPQRLRLRLFFPGDATRDVTVQLEHPETGVPELVGEQVPEVVLINADDFGYGRFRLRNEDVGRAFDYARSASRAIDRALLWEALWEEVRDAELSPATFVERAIGAIGTEPDPLLESQLLARLGGGPQTCAKRCSSAALVSSNALGSLCANCSKCVLCN